MKFIILLLIIVSFVCGLFIGESRGKKEEQLSLKPVDDIILDSLRMGCEFGVLKQCHPKNQKECKQFCVDYLDKEIVNIMKKKGEIIIKEYENRKK